jgi:hypothetical protein
MRVRWRVIVWGMGAAAALSLAAFVVHSKIGWQRLSAAITSEASRLAEAVREAGQRGAAEQERERKRLAEAVRSLTEHRDQLGSRLAALERSLDDMTSSTRREAATQEIPSGRRPIPTTAALLDPPRLAAATGIELGLDIGAGSSLDDLRRLWSAARSQHGALLADLRPLAAVGESRPNGLGLRLVVGPFADAAGAARTCGALAEAGLPCQISIFDGQRLALQ